MRDDYEFRHELSAEEIYSLGLDHYLPFNFHDLEETEKKAALEQGKIDMRADRALARRIAARRAAPSREVKIEGFSI
jgi:hypothetical protein